MEKEVFSSSCKNCSTEIFSTDFALAPFAEGFLTEGLMGCIWGERFSSSESQIRLKKS